MNGSRILILIGISLICVSFVFAVPGIILGTPGVSGGGGTTARAASDCINYQGQIKHIDDAWSRVSRALGVKSGEV
ncbi:hypothetical protein CL620_05555, partial [archaeon]|nr:hypothetical protein [archaeon]